MMNYYWWKSIDGQVGNVHAKTLEDAIDKVEKAFPVRVEKVELLEENVKENKFTREKY